MTAGTLLRACGFGTTCSVSVAEGLETTHAFAAYIGAPSPAPPPSDLQGESGDYLVAFVEHFIQVQSQFYPPQLYSVTASSNVLLTRAFYG